MQVARATYGDYGLSSEEIRREPARLAGPMPTLADFLSVMARTPASTSTMQQTFVERLEKASYLFSGQTSIAIDKPLTVFSIRDLDEKWYALMTYVVQNFLLRHRALRRDVRYLVYVVEEASYILRHPAGRKYLELGARGFRKLGIAQITLSQHPREFLTDGAVILNNAAVACYLGMQSYAARELGLAEELERVMTTAAPGQAVLRVGNSFAAVQIANIPSYHALFTTDPEELRAQGHAVPAAALAGIPQGGTAS